MPQGNDYKPAMVRAFAEADVDYWKRVAELLNERAAALRPYGIRLGFHNHNVEFVPIGKTNGWEILASASDPALVTFEADIGFLAAAGIDPVAFLRRYSGRIRQLHIKDIKATTGVYDASLGARSNETSGRAILARQREGDVSTFHFIDNLSRAIRHGGRVLLDLIPKVYTTERMIRVLGEDLKPSSVQIAPTGEPVRPTTDPAGTIIGHVYDIGAGKYDLTVAAGSSRCGGFVIVRLPRRRSRTQRGSRSGRCTNAAAPTSGAVSPSAAGTTRVLAT